MIGERCANTETPALGDVLKTSGKVLEKIPELEAFASGIERIVEENRRLADAQALEVIDQKEAAEFEHSASRALPISKGPGRPVSRILLYPVIHLRDAPCGSSRAPP